MTYASEDETVAAETLASDSGGNTGRSRADGGPDPERIGRHRVVGRLGAGGMGVVYRAHDPELDRDIAIKLIRPGRVDDIHATRAKQRLLREARAMAKLAHPNVIAVYDVGTLDDDVFIAMELVDGMTLDDWVRAKTRPWREVVRMYVQAGRGLAEAHRAALVHRDFKPANALVGNDGRVRVLDFGLARSEDEDGEVPGDRPEPGELRTTMVTRTGALMGTPAYMSPEQFEGTTADARSDQFSFCVALWEALYGQRPFVGNSVVDLSISVLEGRFADTPSDVKVPDRVVRALRRGMARRPEARHPGMDELLGVLERDPARRRRVTAALFVGALGTAAGGFALARGGVAACDDGADRVAKVWNAERASQLRDRFSASGLPYASDTAEHSVVRLDAFHDRWSAQRMAACEDGRSGDQSAALTDARMLCLERTLQSSEAAADLLIEADAAVVSAAVDTLAALPDPARCADRQFVTAAVEPPGDPATVDAVRTIRHQIAEARVREDAGRYVDAAELAESIHADAEALRYPPVLAEALLLRGRIRNALGAGPAAEADLKEAYWTASEHRHEEVAARAAAHLVSLVGTARARHDDGTVWWRNARAANRRLGIEGDADLARRHADLLAGKGEYDAAISEYDAALASAEADVRNGSADVMPVVAALSGRAAVHTRLTRLDQSAADLDRATELVTEHYGADHPRMSEVLHERGGLAAVAGRVDESLEYHRAALALRARVFDDSHPMVAASRLAVARSLRKQNRADEALELVDGARSALIEALGPTHPAVGGAWAATAAIYLTSRRLDEAEAPLERALSIVRASYGDRSVEYSRTLGDHGVLLELRGDREQARQEYQRALEIQEQVLGDMHPRSADLHTNLGNVDFALGNYDDAARAFFRALEIRKRTLGPDHPDYAIAVMHAAGSYDYTGDIERAAEVHEEAMEAFVRAHGPRYTMVATAGLNASRARERTGEFARALELAERAQSIMEDEATPDPQRDPNMTYAWNYRARALLGLGRIDECVALAEKTLALRQAENMPPMFMANTKLVLGQALWERNAPGDRARAAPLVDAAGRIYDTMGPYAEYERGMVARWRVDRGTSNSG